MKNKKLFIANLSSRAGERDIRKFFEKFGEVVHVKICDNRERFAFVEFETLEEAEKAYRGYIFYLVPPKMTFLTDNCVLSSPKNKENAAEAEIEKAAVILEIENIDEVIVEIEETEEEVTVVIETEIIPTLENATNAVKMAISPETALKKKT
jgi:hypothetical protein